MELLTPSLEILIWSTFCLLIFALMLVSIFSILKNDFSDGRTKLIWLIGVILLPIVGPILYFKNKKKLFQK